MKVVTDRAELARRIAALRGQGKTIVLADGAFDGIDLETARFLADAKSRADILVAAVYPDAPRKPRVRRSLAERLELACALAAVDYATPADGERADRLVRALRPDFLARSREYDEATVPERDALREAGVQLLLCGEPRRRSRARRTPTLVPRRP